VLVFNVFVSSQNASDDNSINNSDVLIENANEKKTTSKEIPQTNNFKTTIRKTYSTSSISESKTTTTVNSSNTSSAVADSSRNHESINSAVSSSPNNENGNTAIPVNQAVADPNQYVVDTNESDEFERFLNEINFKIVKPKNNSTIYSNSSINVEWECDEVPADKKYNISVYLQNLNDSKGEFIKSFINLNDKGGNYTIGELDNKAYNYALWLFTDDYGKHLFYQGPIVINANSTTYINNNTKSILKTQGILSNYLILVVVFIVLLSVLIYIVALIIKAQRKNAKNQKDYNYEYEEFKEYKEPNENKRNSKDSQSIHKLLGIEENMERQDDQSKLGKPSFNSSGSSQTINSLAEQLYKAEQVYNNKVFKNPDMKNVNEHCAPLVDMSSLYKSTQEILNKNARLRNNDYTPVNDSYYNRRIMKNQPSNNNKGDESFVVFDDVKNNTKSVTFGRSDSVNSNKILSQSVSFCLPGESDNDQVNNKPFNVLESNKNSNENSGYFDEGSDEDYINKNSFCLNSSKDSIDAFENIYLNKQSDNSSENVLSQNSMPLTAKVTTVEEFLAAHRESYGSLRLSRSSSLLNGSTVGSSFRDSNSFVNPSINVVPKLGKTNSLLSTEIYTSSNDPNPSTYQSVDPIKKPERPESMARVSGSDFNSSSVYTSMNESLLEELDSIENQIQQQKQQMYHGQQPLLLTSTHPQDIDPNQMNLQMANLHQQGIDTDHILPPFSKGNKFVSLSTASFQPTPPATHASPPIQPKSLAMSSQSNQPSISAKPSLPVQIKSPSSPILKNRASPLSTSSTVYSKSPIKTIQKSQESEATLQVQQTTQDTLSEVNDDEVETIVATHVCNAWYSPNMPDELRMCPGDELIILEKFNDGWGFGQNTKGGVGVFPLDCVTYIDYDDKNRTSVELSPPSMKQTYTKINNNNNNNNYVNNNVKNNNIPGADYNVKPKQAVVFDTNDLYTEEDSNDHIIYNNNVYNHSNNNSNVPNYRSQYQDGYNGYNQKTYMSNTKNNYKTNNNIPIHYY
jgi:uncharacterized membrane protein (DUF106 family)